MSVVVQIKSKREFRQKLAVASWRVGLAPIDPHGFRLGMGLLAERFDRHLDQEAMDNYHRVLSQLLMGEFIRAVETARKGERMLSPGDLLELALS